jgi:hypothetical protein
LLVLCVALSGQIPCLFQTQGGADACPGLLDLAPLGLNLKTVLDRIHTMNKIDEKGFASNKPEYFRSCGSFVTHSVNSVNSVKSLQSPDPG